MNQSKWDAFLPFVARNLHNRVCFDVIKILFYFFRAPLGLDITTEVKEAAIKVPPLKLKIDS